MRTTVTIRLIAAVVIIGAVATDSWGQRLVVDWKLLDELVLRCEGWIGSWSPTSWYKDREEIAAHTKNGTITFSGNELLLGENIAICPPGTLGIPADSLYFSSDGCGNKAKLPEHRQYGTLNTILLKLNLSNTDWRTDRPLGIQGEFHCTKVN
jgi:hypothetical protein